jgi:type II secretion system protein J
MARRNNTRTAFVCGFTLIEVLVAIAILGILMSAVMVSFEQSTRAVNKTQEHAEVLQNVRAVHEQLYRELSQAIINNNRPDGEQVYFQIRQLSPEQSVLRFGCTTSRGLVEIGYQIKPSDQGWHKYELWRLQKTANMWNYATPGWPKLDMTSQDVEPFAFGIVSFKVNFWSSERGDWVHGNWESIERNAMPPKIQIIIKAIPETEAKAARNIDDLSQIKGLETHVTQIMLPQSR